jgi:hypothetical protein
MRCSGISNVYGVVRGVASCHQVEGRGFFVGGDASAAVNAINLTIAGAKGTGMVSANVARGGHLLPGAVDALSGTVAFKSVMFVH